MEDIDRHLNFRVVHKKRSPNTWIRRASQCHRLSKTIEVIAVVVDLRYLAGCKSGQTISAIHKRKLLYSVEIAIKQKDHYLRCVFACEDQLIRCEVIGKLFVIFGAGDGDYLAEGEYSE